MYVCDECGEETEDPRTRNEVSGDGEVVTETICPACEGEYEDELDYLMFEGEW